MHGSGGPLAVSNVSEPHPLCEAFIEAAQQAGHPRNDDFNGAAQEGAGYFQLTAKNGRRWSTAVGYLRPAKRRPNLTVATETLATRVLFSGRRAVGVEYRQGGTTNTAHCQCRGDRRRRRVQLAAIAATLRPRTGGFTARAWHRCHR